MKITTRLSFGFYFLLSMPTFWAVAVVYQNSPAITRLHDCLQTGSVHESFYLLPNFEEARTKTNSSTEVQNKIVGSRSCPRHLIPDGPQYISSRCPWYYELNYDSNRVPSTFIQAKCRCRKCVQTHGECEPANYYIKVLRKEGPPTGNNVYSESWEAITVGCVCVRRTSPKPPDK